MGWKIIATLRERIEAACDAGLRVRTHARAIRLIREDITLPPCEGCVGTAEPACADALPYHSAVGRRERRGLPVSAVTGVVVETASEGEDGAGADTQREVIKVRW